MIPTENDSVCNLLNDAPAAAWKKKAFVVQ